MSDDSFIREVDEELRRDQLRSVWGRYGKYVIGVAILIVVATGAYRGWEYYTDSRAARSGDAYLAAVKLAEDGKSTEAISDLEILAKSGSGRYPELARFRIAGELEATGDKAGALSAFDALAGDNSIDPAFRDIARIRAGLLAVDVEDYAAVKSRLEPLAGAGAPYRATAREGLGLSALKAGANEEAANWYRQISEDVGSDQGARARAAVVLDYLAGIGVSEAG